MEWQKYLVAVGFHVVSSTYCIVVQCSALHVRFQLLNWFWSGEVIYWSLQCIFLLVRWTNKGVGVGTLCINWLLESTYTLNSNHFKILVEFSSQRLPFRKQTLLELKFCSFANDKFDKFKFCLLLYFKRSLNDGLLYDCYLRIKIR